MRTSPGCRSIYPARVLRLAALLFQAAAGLGGHVNLIPFQGDTANFDPLPADLSDTWYSLTARTKLQKGASC